MRQPPTHTIEPDFDHPQMKGLRAWYLMNEGGGRKIYDHSGNKHHADLQNALWKISPVSGPNFPSDATHRMICPTTLRPSKTLTWSVWLNNIPFGGGNKTVMSFDGDPGSDGTLLMSVSAGGIGFHSNDGLGGQDFGLTSGLLGTGLNHVVFVREGDSITGGYKAYANGVFTGTLNTGTYPDLSNVSNYTVGIREFPGQSGSFIQQYAEVIGSIRIYNRALNPREIADEFVNPFGPFDLNHPLEFPATGLTPIMFSSVGRGPMRSAQNLGGHRIGGAS